MQISRLARSARFAEGTHLARIAHVTPWLKAVPPLVRFGRIGLEVALERRRGGPTPEAVEGRSGAAEAVRRLIRGELEALQDRGIPALRKRVDEMALPVLPRFGVRLRRAPVGPLPGWRFDLVAAPDDFDAGGAGGAGGAASDRARLLYLHGGGYVYGSHRSHGAFVAQFAQAARLPVIFPEYRLAPEHPFPAAWQDALAAYEAVLEAGQDPRRLVVAGESAGGGLALALLVALRDRGLPLPAGAVLISPWVDHTLAEPSVQENAPFDVASAEVAAQWSAAYRAGADPEDPRISPLYADLRGLPPVRVQFGGAEMLRDEDRALVSALREAGVSVSASEWPGMFHVWQFAAPVLPEARAAIVELGRMARQVIEGDEVDAARDGAEEAQPSQ